PGDRLIEDALDRLDGRKVRADWTKRAARFIDEPRGLVHRSARNAGDARTRRRKRDRDPLPDPAAGAGDDRGLAGEVERRSHRLRALALRLASLGAEILQLRDRIARLRRFQRGG